MINGNEFSRCCYLYTHIYYSQPRVFSLFMVSRFITWKADGKQEAQLREMLSSVSCVMAKDVMSLSAAPPYRVFSRLAEALVDD